MTYTTNKTKASITTRLFLASEQWSIFPLHKTTVQFHITELFYKGLHICTASVKP